MTDFSALNEKTISFIGGGNMARAIIDGLLKAKHEHHLTLNLGVSDSDPSKLDEFIAKGLSAVSPDDAKQIIEGADVVVLAVKPQVMRDVAGSIAPYLNEQIVLSIAAGLSVDTLSDMLGGYRNIVRCMPNLPASQGFGASGLYASNPSEAARLMTQNIMQASGMVSWVEDESLLHAVTAVAGSAPAYFFYVLENMIAKAVEMGLSPEDAHALAVQSMRGAAALAKDQDPATLREQVTSKGGTTAAALDCLYRDDVGGAFARAMQACSDRSFELGQTLSQS
ncbi:pyrroline-5-carboxylate reductase [Moraxella canis]|uniref:Pyrroline-5-carboxylate reductase n=1 Tax=Moraxella canis TaxID=90239 RepID=A0A1S9ZHP5_9GAMM|nr:pyrroline-5-carboxylate reductase [Moraxella canis]OOR82883.1 pyrroline-5-carboxylate reductase [Moraxella canis]